MKKNHLWRLRTEEYSKVAFETLSELGLSGTTVEKVAQRAGVSKTNVLHYFGSKTRLLEMALRYGHGDLAKEAGELLVRSKSPWERVYAVITANFTKRGFNPKVAHAWLSLCAQVPYDPSYQRIQTVNHNRTRSNLVHALAQITDKDRAETVAFAISSMIDGLWLRCGLQLGGIDRETALAQMEVLLEALFPDDADRLAGKSRIDEIQNILVPD